MKKSSFSDMVPYIKLGGALFLAALVILFTVQNVQATPVQFLFWKVEMSLALLIFGTLAIGVVTGWLITSWLNFTRNRRRKKA